MSSDPIKERLERTVASEFLLLYNLAKGSKFEILRAGVPPEPDIVCKDATTGEDIGIEIATAYYDPDHARAAWGPARGKMTEPWHHTRPDRQENVQILARAIRIIRNKGKKQRTNYAVPGRLLLVVITYSLRFNLRAVRNRLKTLRIPKSHPFDEVYVMSNFGETYCLFPERMRIIL